MWCVGTDPAMIQSNVITLEPLLPPIVDTSRTALMLLMATTQMSGTAESTGSAGEVRESTTLAQMMTMMIIVSNPPHLGHLGTVYIMIVQRIVLQMVSMPKVIAKTHIAVVLVEWDTCNIVLPVLYS